MSELERRDFLRMAAASGLLGGWFLSGCDKTCWDTRYAEDPSKRVFAVYEELASLDYFDLDCDGILHTVIDLPEVVDIHTHLGFAWLDSPPVPLLEQTPQVAYLFDPTLEPTSIDMEDYSNRLATEAILDETTHQSIACVGPLGSDRALTHTIPNLLREMAGLRIGRSVVLPIDLGYGESDDLTNVWLDAIEDAGATDQIIPFGSVHPKDPAWETKLRAMAARGVYGIKLHPTMQQIYPDDDATMAVIQVIDELGLPVLFHSGRAGIEPEFMAKYSVMDHFTRPVAEFPNTPFILGHSGAYLDFEAAVALAQSHSNAWMCLAGPGVGSIQHMIQTLGPERLLYGTDWPFFSQALDLAKVLLATEGDEGARRLILGENALNLLGLS